MTEIAAGAATNVFAYGTLEFPELFEAVVGRRFDSVPARLDRYARFMLTGRSYPGICESPGSHTLGSVYLDLDPGAIERLDRFESSLYERRALWVEIGKGAGLAAAAYVVPAARCHLLSGESWDPQRFRRNHLAVYLAGCARARSSESGPNAD